MNKNVVTTNNAIQVNVNIHNAGFFNCISLIFISEITRTHVKK